MIPIQTIVFLAAVLISLINTRNSILTGIQLVVDSIVCPLIVTVLPGIFYYLVLKQNDDTKMTGQVIGFIYAMVGIVMLPVFLTLSTKTLFTAG
jgi:hypothetical protein